MNGFKAAKLAEAVAAVTHKAHRIAALNFFANLLTIKPP
jgi:hypothetical protein